MARSLLCPDAFLSPLEIDAAVTRALAEDLGRAGDITATATIPEETPARAIVVARAAGVISGLPLVAAAFAKLAPEIEIAADTRDGSAVAAKTALMAVAGPARAVLSAERVALNLLGRLSGVATATHEFVRRVAGTRTRICCTRKTTPGLRALEKYAVRCGGGFNHRFGLDDAMLIKDNHIAVAGGIRAVLERAKAAAGHLVKIEIEVDTLDQLREVIDVGLADAVLLDNMDAATLHRAVAMVAGKFPLEASVGIAPLRRIGAVAPGARAIESVNAELVHLGHLAHPARAYPIGVIVGGFADLGQPKLAVKAFRRDCLGALPHVRLADHIGDAVAGKGELTVQTPVGVLVDDAAHGVGIFAGEDAIEHDLCDRHLPAHGFAAR